MLETVGLVLEGIARHIAGDLRTLIRLTFRKGMSGRAKLMAHHSLIKRKYLTSQCRMGGEGGGNCELCASRGGWPRCAKSFALVNKPGVQAIVKSVREKVAE